MSKMSQLHLTLDEQAVELGFEGLDEALLRGYDVDYEKGKLVRRGLGYSETVEYLAKEQDKAHEAWLKEREEVLEEQKQLHDHLVKLGYDALAESVYRAINFVNKGEC